MSQGDSVPEQVSLDRANLKAGNFLKALSDYGQAIHPLEKFSKAIILIRVIRIELFWQIDLSIISSDETVSAECQEDVDHHLWSF